MENKADKFKQVFASLNGYFLDRAPLSTVSEKQMFNNILSSLKEYYEFRQSKSPMVSEKNEQTDKIKLLLIDLLGVKRTEEYLKYPKEFLQWCINKDFILNPQKVRLEWEKIIIEVESRYNDLKFYETLLLERMKSNEKDLVLLIDTNINVILELHKNTKYMLNILVRIESENKHFIKESDRFTVIHKSELLKYLFNKQIDGLY